MPDTESVSDWIDRLKAGDDNAADRLWQRYVDRLVRLARKKLGGALPISGEEEDVVISAFDGFFRGVNDGRFPKLNDRDDLWRILVVLTERKAWSRLRRASAAKRGGKRVRESRLSSDAEERADSYHLASVVDETPTPEFAAEVAEQLKKLLDALDDARLKDIAVLKMEGYNNSEIARHLETSHRSVERKLSLIRQIWKAESSE